MLRVGLRELLSCNPNHRPYFSRFNSGAPRTVNGRKSPRGPETFLAADRWLGSPSTVVEVTFVGTVSLPKTTEFLDRGEWRKI